MPSKRLTTTLIILAVSVMITGNARAIADPDNLGYEGPIMDLGMSPRIHPSAAMVLVLGTDKARLRIQRVHGKPQP